MWVKGGEISPSSCERWRSDIPNPRPTTVAVAVAAPAADNTACGAGKTCKNLRKCRCRHRRTTRTMTDGLVLNLDLPLDVRMSEFKNDPERMREVNEFLDEVVEKAKIEAELRQAKTKSKLDPLGLQSGGKKIGASIHKAKTSARTFASKVITVICNCTNSFKTVVANRN